MLGSAPCGSNLSRRITIREATFFTTERYMWKKKIQPNCEKYIADYMVSLFYICFDIFGMQFD